MQGVVMNPVSPRLPDPRALQQSAQPTDDEIYENSPLQFTADRMGKLVRIAERDPKKQVMVPVDTMNKLYMAFLGVLEIYQEHTAAGVVINGERHNCSVALQKAIAPLIDQNRRLKAEADLDRELAAMMGESAGKKPAQAAPPPLRPR
jgi:hypothetical protein